MDFEEAEKFDGVRFSWNIWPTNRVDQLTTVVPLGCLYTPLIRNDEVIENRCQYNPLVCRNDKCSSILSEWCDVDWVNKMWVCPLCLSRNPFPPEYQEYSADDPPPELLENSTTIEYEIENDEKVEQGSPTFLYVVDTALPKEELEQIKTSIQQSLQLLPTDSMVGLITFGKHVSVHEIGYKLCNKSIVFRGDMNISETEKIKEFTIDKIKLLLELNPNDDQSILKYLQPISEIEDTFFELIDSLTSDSFERKKKCRRDRCIGVACQVGTALLEGSLQGYSARMMLFIGGACTVGPGKIVESDLGEHLRGHRDIIKGKAPLYEQAVEYYTNIAYHSVQNGHIIDIFACCLDQLGIAEMRIMVDHTGGLLVLSDTFTTNTFIESFANLFITNEDEETLSMCFNAEIRIRCSRQIKVSGCIGPCSSMKEKTNSISTNEIGLGGTSKWSIGGLNTNTTLCFMFDLSSTLDKNQDISHETGYIQFVTTYRTSYGSNVKRVTTIGIQFANINKKEGLEKLISGFDQEASACILARYATYKADNEFEPDLMRWLDHQLIKTISKFAVYQKGDIDSFALPNEFLLFPQFIYYLRRSQFIQVFGYSPDETAFFRAILLRENVANSLSMIQPLLHAYDMDKEECEPVLLELSSRHPDRILLLDTFFNLVIYYGRNIAKWRDDKIWLKNNENNEDYTWFKDMLDMPEQECENRALMRFPYPNVIKCDENSGQQRFLIAKLNPDKTEEEKRDDNEKAIGDVFSDDVSLRVFMQHLKRLAVNPP